ncbi:HIT family protein [Actinomarinicola tropica]|uniref:HIT domain-containing protein n=1 Tax=Actinomarinicola tropica TaxID=2789776 RepID=A0A5Q2RJP9_9ACTN|nr:HIT domain-containing protein [Actinomarinicola tropica]QGG95132.1 HIT domain-containing protein [Actinomarinicola tropica]
MPSLDRIWAGWRIPYIEASGAEEPPPGEGSLFERILALPDEEGMVVRRGRTCAALLNAYPYSNGHLMVLPNRAVAELEGLDDEEHAELWSLVRDGTAAIKAAYRPDGVNIGVNLGRGAGAGVPDHLHVHVLPRWAGDTNFMTSVAETRVLPEPLGDAWRKLRAAWPG